MCIIFSTGDTDSKDGKTKRKARRGSAKKGDIVKDSASVRDYLIIYVHSYLCPCNVRVINVD